MKNPFRSFIDKLRMPEVRLEFQVDATDDDRHIVQIYANFGGEKEKVKSVSEIWHYGAILVRDGVKYVIPSDGIEILLSMRSLNPSITEDGDLSFDVCPPVLRYLRTKRDVRESDKSKEFKVHSKPLSLAANVITG